MGNQPWTDNKKGRGYKKNSLEKLPRFLIVCEGQTEQLYFESFRVLTTTVINFGMGETPLRILKEAIRLSKEKYDYTWCVFDFDTNPLIVEKKQNFNQAIIDAKRIGINCAYSNDSFELWFVLHYHYTDQELHRREYNRKLSELWQTNYEDNGKNRKFASLIYEKLKKDPLADQSNAIHFAKRLYNDQKDKEYHLQNPTTTVFQLVEVLNQYLRE